jgi:hypothetical protein
LILAIVPVTTKRVLLPLKVNPLAAVNPVVVLRLNIAVPLLVREIRPDGLTRAIVGSISYQYKF